MRLRDGAAVHRCLPRVRSRRSVGKTRKWASRSVQDNTVRLNLKSVNGGFDTRTLQGVFCSGEVCGTSRHGSTPKCEVLHRLADAQEGVAPPSRRWRFVRRFVGNASSLSCGVARLGEASLRPRFSERQQRREKRQLLRYAHRIVRTNHAAHCWRRTDAFMAKHDDRRLRCDADVPGAVRRTKFPAASLGAAPPHRSSCSNHRKPDVKPIPERASLTKISCHRRDIARNALERRTNRRNNRSVCTSVSACLCHPTSREMADDIL